MGLLDIASGKSIWRGYEYYKSNMVILHTIVSDSEIKGVVQGSGISKYDVAINIEHPRKSKCNCPHANGKRIICKHMIALYFTTFPKLADDYYQKVLEYEREQEAYEEELYDNVIEYVHKMKKSDLAEALLQVLFDGPEWQYDKFIREYMDE